MDLDQIKKLFVVAALYDFILGIVFLLGFRQIYSYCGVALPNHDGYVQFAAALVTIFGIGFGFVARAPERNRDIIKMGICLKLAYSGIVLGHWFFGSIPSVWMPFAWVDLVFLLVFVKVLRALPVKD